MNSTQVWQAVIGQLQMEMTRAAFDTWVKNAELISYSDSVFTVGVTNAYARDWLDSRLSASVNRLLTGMMGSTQQVRFIVKYQEAELPAVEEVPQTAVTEALPQQTVTPHRGLKYSFDSFIVGSCNRLAHAAAMAVVDNPAQAYNPLFIYSGVGLGKTHLLHAIGNACQEKGLNAIYVSSEEFTNDLINSIRTHDTNAFRERYRTIDVLLIDDIHFIAGKESTQEEFFHTFNTLHSMDKQIVMTSDRSPKAMNTLEERLKSRFGWGLIVDLQTPDYETRLAILQSKAELMKREVPLGILEFIAQQVQSNIRELEGSLTRVVAYAELSGQEINLQLVQSALADIIHLQNTIKPDQVVETVAEAYGVTADQLIGPGRAKNVAFPRQIAMYLLREDGHSSLPQIGAVMGGRDHTTVLYACEKIAGLMKKDELFRKQLSKMRDQLYLKQSN